MKVNTDSIARKISQLVLKIQMEFALFMSRVTSSYSARTLKTGLILCCLLLSSLSTWFIIDAFKINKAVNSAIVTHIKFIPVLKANQKPGAILTKTDYNGLQGFLRYMDSLALDKPGKIIYDSILKARPGLMDSVRTLGNIYLSQQK